MAKYDTSEPILVLVRRGRKGRGFSISPVEDLSNAAICATAVEVGEVIEEMLDDETQARVNINDLLRAATEQVPVVSDDGSEAEDENVDDGGGNGDGDGIFDGVAGSENPADRLMFNIFSSVVSKGRNMSSKKVPASSRKGR